MIAQVGLHLVLAAFMPYPIDIVVLNHDEALLSGADAEMKSRVLLSVSAENKNV